MHSASSASGSADPRLNETHDPALRSFVASANRPDADFPIQNLPLAVFRPGREGAIFASALVSVTASWTSRRRVHVSTPRPRRRSRLAAKRR